MFLHNFNEIIRPYNIVYGTNVTFDKKKPIRIFDDFTSQIFFHAFNYYTNLEVCVLINTTKGVAEAFYKDTLKEHYELYGLKKISVCSELFERVMMQMYWQRKLPKIKTSIGKIHSLIILFLRKININFNPPENNDLIFFPRSECEINSVLPIFLCPHTLQFLSDILYYENFPKSMKRFNLYCNWVFENFPHTEREKILVFSSNILQLMGLRESSDIDIIVGEVLPEESRQKALLQRQKWIDEADMIIRGTDRWPTHWDEWTQTWAEAAGANNFQELFNLDKYHIYYHGVKVAGLTFDIARRKLRNSMPRRIADLIAIKLKLNRPDITFPILAKKYSSQFVKVDNLTSHQIQKLREKNNTFFGKNQIEIRMPICQKKFLETVRWFLENERYKFKLDMDYIKSIIQFVD